MILSIDIDKVNANELLTYIRELVEQFAVAQKLKDTLKGPNHLDYFDEKFLRILSLTKTVGEDE